MIDLYLKAASQAAMTTALLAAGFLQDAESGTLYHDGTALDVIGTIYAPSGEVAMVEEEEMPVMAPLPGWHVNVRTTDPELAEALTALRLYPTTPARVWA